MAKKWKLFSKNAVFCENYIKYLKYLSTRFFIKNIQKTYWQPSFYVLKSELWKYFSLYLEIIFIIFTKRSRKWRKNENYFQKRQKARKEAKYWTGLYCRRSSCITTWVSLKRESLIGYSPTRERSCHIPFLTLPLCVKAVRQR